MRTLVLAGGGHAHALLLRQWARLPLPDVRLLVVSPSPLTPYSGMLPGYVAGHYSFAAIHIDLARLCRRAGAELILDCVTGLDAATRTVLLAANPPLRYDLLSLDTGATPAQRIPGVAEFALPVKPISAFIPRWHALRDSLRSAPVQQHLLIVGGGAGSVEVALALAHAARRDPLLRHKPQLTLVTREPDLLPGYPPRMITIVAEHCRKLNVDVVNDFDVGEVRAGSLHESAGIAVLHFDHLFWCTEAAAPAWLQQSGLALSERGFVRVDAKLQSLTDPAVFAAGDVAHFEPCPLPKAGVYAVRQAPVLYANLCHALRGEALENYRPQHSFLSLLALGAKVAAGSRGRLTVAGKWVWHWKNRIDRRFMAQFR